ncbi:Starch-binding associating with outer membrane [Chitinophaga sp. CF118]|uniref:SusD/RagB family nutrient-binding outer membrane lipoprotein n=1 Tax=Chitinophaga sp. CF118 TaxID=1884367 RepID=UPI0008E8E789|nr:SusD/RagB family nutrient-binding outer membrane lipoprotein [Chitinophaga sp. CF118]SFD29468.1 Starch-binding associating with outer membrane [Chitinophaga sp. CF118]
MIKRNIIKSAICLLTVLSLTITGCKDFLDVNDNPNLSESAEPKLLLPSAQASIALVLGNHYQVYGGIWSQYWTQNFGNSQFKSIEQYILQASNFDRPWQTLYADAMADLQIIINQRNVTKYKQYAAIAMLLKAYDLQLLTDAFGDIPLKDALKGENDNISPKYDSQKEVYDSIFAIIDNAKTMIDPESEFLPGAEDLIFGGDMDKWIQFANTLKLRAYLRLSEVDAATAQAGITALAGVDFLTEDASIVYISTGGNQNPLYAELVALGKYRQLRASRTVVSQMNALNDPRVTAYFQLTGGLIKSMPQGSYDTNPNGASTPVPAMGADPLTAASAQAPVKFMSSYESYFLQAEAVARGWLTGDATTLYQEGITASFQAYNATPGTYITTQLAAFPATKAAQIEAIIVQKYFAMCCNQSFEAWTEWRRTGYPTFFVTPVVSSLPAGTFPVRFLYPNTELTRNPNFPGAKLVTDKVWWDVN